MNLYSFPDKDYRAELLELNRTNGKVIASYPINDFVVIEKDDRTEEFQFGTNVMIGGMVYTNKMLDVGNQPYASLNFISYGKSHLDGSWRFLSLGAGMNGATLLPVSYRISNQIPLLSDVFLDSAIVFGYDGNLSIGLGIGSTF
jgi:hypothetical protein